MFYKCVNYHRSNQSICQEAYLHDNTLHFFLIYYYKVVSYMHIMSNRCQIIFLTVTLLLSFNQSQLIMLSASANKLSKLKEQAEEYASLIMEELDPENLGYIEVNHKFNLQMMIKLLVYLCSSFLNRPRAAGLFLCFWFFDFKLNILIFLYCFDM